MAVTVKKGFLKSFSPSDYTACIQICGSHAAYLTSVRTARNIDDDEMIAGRMVAVLCFDEFNPDEALVIAVFTGKG